MFELLRFGRYLVSHLLFLSTTESCVPSESTASSSSCGVYTGTLAPLTKLSSVFLDGALAGMVGLIVAGCILSLLENQEFRDLLQSLRKISRSALKPTGLPSDTV